MPTQRAEIDYAKRAFLLVGAVLVARLVYAAIFPVNPAGDEAYYWDWGRRLDWGYYSKPPLIAWLYALVDWLGGGSLFAIRATAAVLGTGALLVLFRLASSLFDPRVGWLAVLFGVAAPANSALSFFLTIDAPLVVCWSTALWMLWRYVSGVGGAGTLVLLFVALGLGHLSKQMMMLFPLLAVIYVVLRRETRPLLRRPGLWVTLLGSYLSLVPPLVWNARHDWITFRHTGHHFESGAEGGNVLVERAGDFLAFLGTQLGVLSPVIGFNLFALCLVCLPLIRRASAPMRFVLVFGALPLALMLLMALRQEMQPNWPAVFHVSGIALAAAWYGGRFDVRFPRPQWRLHFPVAVGVGIFLVLYFYFGTFLFQALDQPGHQADPNRRLLSHDRLAAKVQCFREKLPNGEEPFIVALGHRDVASHLAFGLPDQPRVYHYDGSARIDSQYELWPDPQADGRAGEDALIVAPRSDSLPVKLGDAFETLERIGTFEVVYGIDETISYSVFRGRELRGWPRRNASPPTSP